MAERDISLKLILIGQIAKFPPSFQIYQKRNRDIHTPSLTVWIVTLHSHQRYFTPCIRLKSLLIKMSQQSLSSSSQKTTSSSSTDTDSRANMNPNDVIEITPLRVMAVDPTR